MIEKVTVTVIVVVALSLGNALAADPPAANGRGPRLQFELVDGTVITGSTDIKAITIQMASGNVLKVPVAELTELSVGLNGRGKPQIKIQAGGTVLLGTVAVKEFRIASPYGPVTVKLDEVFRIRPGVLANPGKFGRWSVELHDETRLRGVVTNKSLRVETRYGTMVIPLARIQKATFTADGKSIRIQCWGSDRIAGALKPSTTISFKTDKGGTDLPAGKIAAVAYGPLTLKGHSRTVRSLAFSPDGKRLASGSGDDTSRGNIKIWDTLTGKELLTIKRESLNVYSLAFSSDGKRLASGSIVDLTLWDTVTGKKLLAFKGHPQEINSIAFSPDGKRLASGSEDMTIKLWDTVTGKELLTIEGHSDRVNSIAFSPDGKRLASGSDDGPIKLWDTVTGKKLLEIKGHPCEPPKDDEPDFFPNGVYSVFSLAFSPDGKRLASGSNDRTIKLWNSITGKELLTLKRHSDSVCAMAFSPDSKHLASISGRRCDRGDKSITLWDTITGKELFKIKGHTRWVFSIAFSPDGKCLASGSDNGDIKIWNMPDWTKPPK